MQIIATYLAFTILALLDLISAQSIPTQTEQANLLRDVNEVFELLKLAADEESDIVLKSVEHDVDLIEKRASYTLGLLERIILMRLSCDANSISSLDYRPHIKTVKLEGVAALTACSASSLDRVRSGAAHLKNITTHAVSSGQGVLNKLDACSKKSGLAVIACYRNIIVNDVTPVKVALMDTIKTHKEKCSEVAAIRNDVNKCVDMTVEQYRSLLEVELEKALRNMT
ncbi:unnamed protein product [Acanthoscelides obtectus]|uniref:Protein TsetseEP domain-containing protein n=1 Tax=Acanthoscelides obtectus TaxID=200917 RepID=A0A9P0KBK4_ACAOB|nr:unnamed protein product [Acanthoscelides obtectus]CAK1622795.1 hypothetical protein AOBTE_LOCUS1671 [Acanthoscelides obtectus]